MIWHSIQQTLRNSSTLRKRFEMISYSTMKVSKSFHGHNINHKLIILIVWLRAFHLVVQIQQMWLLEWLSSKISIFQNHQESFHSSREFHIDIHTSTRQFQVAYKIVIRTSDSSGYR